jgi:CTP:molybdopterin cytidylyltransferase MocA
MEPTFPAISCDFCAKPHPYAVHVTTTAVLLAAGGGSRFAGTTHKLLATIDGVPVFRRSLDHLLGAEFDRVVVVTGAVALEIEDGGVTTVHNPKWEDGQAGSLQLALAAATDRGSDVVVVGLADQPFIPSSAWRAVADAPSTAPIVVATYGGVRGPNPVRLHKSVWPHLPTDGDEGAKPVMRLHPNWVDEVACEGSAADIDTLEDLRSWTNF